MRRLRQIQTSNHELVEVLGLIHFTEGQYPTRLAEVRERELHLQFASLQRFKPGTRGEEWFTPSAELLEFIHTNAQRSEDLGVSRFIGQQYTVDRSITEPPNPAPAADG